VTVPVLLVRLLPGLVGESRRVVHVVPVVNAEEVPPVLVAYCGEPIERGTAEVLPDMVGMPCERCVLATPIPNAGEFATGEVSSTGPPPTS
jgi:hypothetical protein